MIVRKVRPSGQLRWRGYDPYLSETLVGEPVAFEQIDDRHFQIYYGPIKLAVLDDFKKQIIKPKTKVRKRR